MKKFVLIALSLIMALFIFGGCNNKNNNSQKPTTSKSSYSEWETPKIPI